VKNAAILIIGAVIGYFVFSLLNPQPTETFTIKTRTIKQTDTVPIAVRDTRYHAPDSEIAPKAGPAEINIKVEPVTEIKNEVVNQVVDKKKLEEKSKSKKNRFQFGFKTFVGFNQIPFLLTTDPKLMKIKGDYSGTLTITLGRREVPAKVNLKIEENETTMTVIDGVDTIDDSFTFIRSTSEVFKTFPEDENLLLLATNSDNSFVFDLRDLPKLKGKAFARSVQIGEVELLKKVAKK
jgi:hypothetical protein